jgi:hypothetical protein
MTPTEITLTPDNQGCVLTYRLDHALSNKGMGISLPELPQPGETTNAVLREVERAWLLIFAMLALSLTLVAERHTVLLTMLFGAATAFSYGLLGDFSDLLFGFWGTAALVLLPMFVLLAWLLKRITTGIGKMLAALLILFGIVYPCAAGLGANWQTLYLNLCALILLAFTAKLLAGHFSSGKTTSAN